MTFIELIGEHQRELEQLSNYKEDWKLMKDLLWRIQNTTDSAEVYDAIAEVGAKLKIQNTLKRKLWDFLRKNWRSASMR